MEASFLVKQFVELFAVIDPIGAVVLFTALTRAHSPEERSRAAVVAPAVMAALLFVMAVAGEGVLSFFSISIHSFMVGGGLLILLTGIGMMGAYGPFVRNALADAEDEARLGVAVVPLAVPLLAGPGAITTVIIAGHTAEGLAGYGMLALIIALIAFITLLLFRNAERIGALLGRTGMGIFTRLLGLLLAAYSVEIIAAGLKGLFPAR